MTKTPPMTDELRKALAKYEWNPNFQDDLTSPDQATSEGDTPLHLAAIRGDVEDARIFLAHGASIDRIGDMGQTPLHYAAMQGHMPMVEFLVDQGARLDIVSEFGDMPERAAAYGKHDAVGDFLRRRRLGASQQ